MAKSKKDKEKTQQKKRKKLVRYNFRRERVEQKLKEGWKLVPMKSAHFRDGLSDLVLMEKSI